MAVTYYKSHAEVVKGEVMTLDDFINKIRLGVWKDAVLKARAVRVHDYERYQKIIKPSMPCVAFGVFSRREDKSLQEHAGVICVDFDPKDNPDLLIPEKFEAIKQQLGIDKYSMYVVNSLSGVGLFVIVKINGNKHRESFEGLRNYYYNEYGLIMDSSGGNVSKPRCVTYDNAIYANENAVLFKNYLKVEKIKVQPIVYSGHDLDFVLRQIREKGIDLTAPTATQNGYQRWLNIGFAFAHKYGEGGRDYFHAVSSMSPLYDYGQCQRQYNSILKHKGSGNQITIATFFAYCKEAGIELTTEKTGEIKTAAIQAKKSKRTKESVVDMLLELNVISEDERNLAEDITNQVYSLNNEQLKDERSMIARLQHYIRANWKIRRNEITNYYEIQDHNGKYRPLEKEDYNNIYINAKIVVDIQVKKEDVKSIIENSDTPSHHPILSFINSNKTLNPKGYIDQVIDCLGYEEPTRKINGKEMSYREFMRYFFVKWYVGIIKSIEKEHNPMFLVFAGPINIGKTRFFRGLLPEELSDYFAESDFSEKKDDKILMSKKLIIYCDEMDGINGDSAESQRKFKAMTEYKKITQRVVYGDKSTDMLRLATLCGSSNDTDLLKDPHGNRRILPFKIKSIDLERYEKIDKTNLFMEIYQLSKTMPKWYMTPEDVELLAKWTKEFKAPDKAVDLIEHYFRIPQGDEPRLYLSSTMIQAYIEKSSGMKLTSKSIGSTLQRMGFKCGTIRIQQETGLGSFKDLQNYYQVVENHKNPQIIPIKCYRDEKGEPISYTSDDFN
jgi:predicted P-loop ATPase